MDLISDVFSVLKVKAHVSARFEAGGNWSVRFPKQSHIKFAAALRGSYWLTLDSHADTPRRIQTGDTYLLTNATSYVIASDPELEPVEGSTLYEAASDNRVHYGGNEILILGGSFILSERHAGLLMEMLPPLILIPGADPASAVLTGSLELLDDELFNQSMGTPLVTNRLGDILLVQAIRSYVASGASICWLGAMGHPKLGAALRLMHSDVTRHWKVEELALAAGMSRSDFAKKFKECVGVTPLGYLIRWRMHLARQALGEEGASVAAVAHSVGYASESAFGNAFKRIFGHSPKRHWANARRRPVG